MFLRAGPIILKRNCSRRLYARLRLEFACTGCLDRRISYAGDLYARRAGKSAGGADRRGGRGLCPGTGPGGGGADCGEGKEAAPHRCGEEEAGEADHRHRGGGGNFERYRVWNVVPGLSGGRFPWGHLRRARLHRLYSKRGPGQRERQRQGDLHRQHSRQRHSAAGSCVWGRRGDGRSAPVYGL